MSDLRRPTTPASSETTADQLKQLADLRDNGSLTAEEYETAKTQLLNGG